MGMHCACGVKISPSTNQGNCVCEWDGWVTYADDGSMPNPDESVLYHVRYGDNGGDLHEGEMHFHVDPIRFDCGFSGTKRIPIHWQEESWDDIYVYAWKKKE